MKVTKMDDILPFGRHKGKTVREMIEKKPETARKNIMTYLKNGLYFDDEVINTVGIKKIVHEPTITNVVVDRKPYEDTRTMPKDRAKLSTILKELHTIDNTIDNFAINDNDDNEEDI